MTASSGSHFIQGYPEAGFPPSHIGMEPVGMTVQPCLRSPGSLALFTWEAEIHWRSELSQRGFYTEGFWTRVPVPFLA